MEGLLTLFIALTALAVLTQAGVLVALYVQSKRLSEQVERFMRDTREVMAPLRSITDDLKTASANVVDIGSSARDQFRRVEAMVATAGEALNVQIERFDRLSLGVIERINETADIVQDSVLRPVREVAAITKGVGRGLELIFSRKRRSTVDQARQDEELFI